MKRNTDHKRKYQPYNGLSITFFDFQKRLYISLFEKLCNWMKQFVCEKLLSGTSSQIMVTDTLGIIIQWVNLPRQRAWESLSNETNYLDKATGCLEEILKSNDSLW